jgi:hypothetical protein
MIHSPPKNGWRTTKISPISCNQSATALNFHFIPICNDAILMSQTPPSHRWSHSMTSAGSNAEKAKQQYKKITLHFGFNWNFVNTLFQKPKIVIQNT